MYKKRRWILLEHTDCPDDPNGIHFDLLLEDQDVCRSWRLKEKLILDGTAQEAVLIDVHRLEWLSVSSREVSEGRGWARRVMGGFYYGDLPIYETDGIHIEISTHEFFGILEIKNCMCHLSSV